MAVATIEALSLCCTAACFALRRLISIALAKAADRQQQVFVGWTEQGLPVYVWRAIMLRLCDPEVRGDASSVVWRVPGAVAGDEIMFSQPKFAAVLQICISTVLGCGVLH
jgi:hypothetical protein